MGPGSIYELNDGWRSARAWTALAILVAASFLEQSAEAAVYHPIAQAAGLRMIRHETMALAPYGLLMIVRLAWNLALVLAVVRTLGRPLAGSLLCVRGFGRHLGLGLGTGLLVMVAAILCIVAARAAVVAPAAQPIATTLSFGGGWLLFDLVGAAGEELYGRAAVLLVAERFVGSRGAILVSGLMFAVIHLGNPGATGVWLLRLFLQGMFLADAVYLTGSLWWSIGYHTGWNWASAPLFGAAGSGYLDEGHVFDFAARGSAWITGGSVGPEGSLFAFAAVLAAWRLLHFVAGHSTPQRFDPNSANTVR